MKKLRLNTSAFNKSEVLSRSQLKKVLGGNGPGSKGHPCVGDIDCSPPNGLCRGGYCCPADNYLLECWDGSGR